MPKIQALRVQNFKRLSEVDIEPGGRQIVILGGKNAQGKSSVLDAIQGALAGKSALPDEPVHRGQDRGCIEIELDDGIVIRRTLTRKDDGSTGGTLKISTADGMSPSGGAQKWLDQRVGAMTVDPLAFLHRDPKAQAEQLRQIAGIDTAEIDGRISELRAERTLKGREAKRAAGAASQAVRFEGVPDVVPEPVVVSASDIVAKLDEATATVRALEAAERAVSDAKGAVVKGEGLIADIDTNITDTEAEIARLMAKVESLRKTRATYTAALDIRKGAVNDAEAARDAARAAVVDPAPFRAQLADLERSNNAARQQAADIARKVEANKRADEVKARADALQAEYNGMTEAIRAVEVERAEMLASAPMPVSGLGLSADGVVLFDRLPLSQASQAQRMRVSLAIALAGAPVDGIRVALIRDASLLDEDSMQLVADLAAEMDAQVWLERVGTADDGAVVIVDGAVAGV